MSAEPAALLDLAARTAREAGELLRARRLTDEVSIARTKSTPTDIVTAMDTASEALIRDRLRAERPDDTILGEEGGSVPGGSGVRWLVDPLDGTVNYLYGLPAYAVSIAAEVAGEVVAGAVFSPPTGELWTAVRDSGAWLNDDPVRAASVPELDGALVGTGFWYDSGLRARQAELLRHVLPRVRDVRRIGSAALDLCSVACGRLDAYYETGLHPWDWSAGLLVAREAGARVGGLPGEAASRQLTIAAAPGVFDELRALVVPQGADVVGCPVVPGGAGRAPRDS